jgi:hypothetical protein
VREDYSEDGNCWGFFPHEHARSRAYRWGEDGLLGFTDRQCRICLSVALWNGRDRFLKERLFGLTNPEGNHSEDVKEEYYYLRNTPTHSYLKASYKYPQRAFPYKQPDFWKHYDRRPEKLAKFEALAARGRPLTAFKAPAGPEGKAVTQEFQKAEIAKSIAFLRREIGLGLRT